MLDSGRRTPPVYPNEIEHNSYLNKSTLELKPLAQVKVPTIPYS